VGDEKIVRGKWLMDGASTLSEAAKKLREEAGRLEEMERIGWQLREPITEDYGFMVRPQR
jgi:hypothetical protein